DGLAAVDRPPHGAGLEGSAEQQAALGPGCRNVGEPRLLLGVALGGALGELLVVVQPLRRATEAAELDPDPGQLVALGPLLSGLDAERRPAELQVAAEVRHGDHAELEALRAVDG